MVNKVLKWVPVDERKEASVGYFSNPASEILLVIRPNGLLCLPAGKKEKGETHLDCLSREMKEELDVVVLSYTKLFGLWNDDVVEVVFHVRDYRGTIHNNEPKKCRYVGWYDMYKCIDAVSSHDVAASVFATLMHHASREGWTPLLNELRRRFPNEFALYVSQFVPKDQFFVDISHGRRS